MERLSDCYVLRNGVQIPCVGFGTWKAPAGKTAVQAVLKALECGYRHIDTAAIYGNEKSVGQALRQSALPREELFVTSKLWNSERGYDKTLTAFAKTCHDLQLSYLDLYLIHWPAVQGGPTAGQALNLETWRALEYLYEQGKVRAIGLSNFLPHHLQPLLAEAKIQPMIDQIEFHPGYWQAEAVRYAQEQGMLVEAWSPLGGGMVLDNPELQQIAVRYGKSVAQICVRWCLQHGTLPLPKSVTPDRIAENAQVFDFALTEADMAMIDALPSMGFSKLHPDTNKF